MDGPPARRGCKVAHVVSSTKVRPEKPAGGVDAVVAEVRGRWAQRPTAARRPRRWRWFRRCAQAVAIPLIAAGGIATGRGSMLAAFALGAEGIQMGTRFALSEESSASDAFKKLCIGLEKRATRAGAEETQSDTPDPQRLFPCAVEEGKRNRGATAEELQQLLDAGRSKQGIFEGDLTDGELERAGSLADPRAADGGTNRPRNHCRNTRPGCRDFKASRAGSSPAADEQGTPGNPVGSRRAKVSEPASRLRNAPSEVE